MWEKHQQSIMAHAKLISARSITHLSDTTFHVDSQTSRGQIYLVDTWVVICECPDFPRIQLCKHLAAVQGHPTDIPTTPMVHESGPSTFTADRAPESTSSDHLPKRDQLSPNANLWKETQDNTYHRISPKKVLHNSTTEHIGHTGKRKIILNNPYCGGEQLGKCAKSDATSTAANAHARTLG